MDLRDGQLNIFDGRKVLKNFGADDNIEKFVRERKSCAGSDDKSAVPVIGSEKLLSAGVDVYGMG